MFDAERLLGGLLSGGMRGGGLNRHAGKLGGLAGMGNKAALGMGLLGVAIAAFEHYTENRSTGGAGSAPQPVAGIPPQPPGGAPPPPPPGTPPVTAAIAGQAAAPPDTAEQDAVQREATLYLRGMIAAAASDGAIDAEERSRILGQLEKTGLDPQEREFLLAEMDLPATIDELTAAVEGRQQALRLYISSLLAVEVDTDAERDHLRRLGERLQLPAETLAAIHLRYNVTV